MKIAIYGIFELASGKCLYIGQTINPKARFWQHTRGRKGKFDEDLVRMEILKLVDGGMEAGNEELRFIKQYKAIGEAAGNTDERRHVSGFNGDPHYRILETGRTFTSLLEAGHFFGRNQGYVGVALRKKGGKIAPGITLISLWPTKN